MKSDAWEKYNKTCEKLIVAFLDKYYPDESIDTVYFVGDEKYTGVFMTDDERFYDIGFVGECFQYNATFEDIYTYQDYVIDCGVYYKQQGINFKNWVKYPQLRRDAEKEPYKKEVVLAKLLQRCIRAMEGVTMHDPLIQEICSETREYTDTFNHFDA